MAVVGALMSQPAPSGTASSRLGKSTRRAVTRAAPLLAAVGLTGVAGASFAPFYAGLGWRLPVFAALVVGTALAVWLRVVSWHPVVRVMIAVVATVAVSATLSTLLSRTGSPVAVGALRDAILAPLQGWSRMLSVGLPAEPTPDSARSAGCRDLRRLPFLRPHRHPIADSAACRPAPLPAVPARPARHRDRAGATDSGWLWPSSSCRCCWRWCRPRRTGTEPGHRPWITT